MPAPILSQRDLLLTAATLAVAGHSSAGSP
jgi:hypothetical protein